MAERSAEDQISLNKYISSTGFCSRREADILIEQGRVTVNGKLVAVAVKISPADRVEVDGEKLKPKKQAIYIAFNKPKGITSTTDPKDKGNIIYYINYPKRIFPIGRLDKDSEGLIFLTNDGDIVNKILRAANNHEKEYIVTVNKPLAPDFVRKMSEGIPILGTVTKKCVVRQEGQKRFRIILTQGLNRQIRRMCEHLGYRVVSLVRTRVMNITLSNIPLGKWRYLSQAEIDTINKMVSKSSKTEEASFEETPKRIRKEKTEKPAKKKEETEEKNEKKKKPTSYKDFKKRRR